MKRGYLYGLIAALFVAGLLGLRACREKKIDADIKTPVLAPSDSAKIIIDPRRHTIVTVTRNPDGSTKTTGTFLPPTGASVSVGRGGSILVTSRSWGTEVNPFLGVAFGSDIRLRAALGLNVFYFRQWEFGMGALAGSDVRDTRVFAHISYSPYASYFVSVGVDNRQTAHLIAGLKF